jgi:putative two-component system response regulator
MLLPDTGIRHCTTDFNRFVQIGLETHGYEVVAVRNGRQALEFIAEETPALVVLDVSMPEMDGFQVMQALNEDTSTARIPVIMLSGRDAHPDVLRGWTMGAALYLTKPCTVEELTSAVDDVLRYRDAQEETGTGFLPAPPF